MIYKSTDENMTRAYNLHKAHSDLPGVPSTLSVPWLPLDPNLPLPYHFAEGRVPCTFPPKNKNTTRNQKPSGTKANTATPNRREPVNMETQNNQPPTNPFRKRRRAAHSKAMMKIYRQANRGPNWKFWNETEKSRDEMAQSGGENVRICCNLLTLLAVKRLVREGYFPPKPLFVTVCYC